jgi:hypothetical protein
MKKILLSIFMVLMCASISFSATETQRPTSDYQIGGSPGYVPGSPANYFSHVSETTRDDSAYMYWNGTPGELIMGFSKFSVPENATNISLAIYFTSAIQSAGVSTMGVAVTVSNTAYPISASLINPTTSYSLYGYALTTNPATESAWSVDEINGGGTKPLQAFGIYSTDCSPIVACSWCYAEVSYDITTPTPTVIKRKKSFSKSYWWGWY